MSQERVSDSLEKSPRLKQARFTIKHTTQEDTRGLGIRVFVIGGRVRMSGLRNGGPRCALARRPQPRSGQLPRSSVQPPRVGPRARASFADQKSAIVVASVPPPAPYLASTEPDREHRRTIVLPDTTSPPSEPLSCSTKPPAMSGPPQPPRGGLSLYADLLEPSTESPATISSAPVLYNETAEQQPAKNPGPSPEPLPAPPSAPL